MIDMHFAENLIVLINKDKQIQGTSYENLGNKFRKDLEFCS